MTPLYESSSLCIWYDDRGFIFAEGRGFAKPWRVKKDSMLVIDQMQAHGCDRAIFDCRPLKGTWLQVIPWFAKKFFPRAGELGINRGALIYNPGSFGQRSVERMIAVNNHLELQAFQRYQEAEDWILGKEPQMQKNKTPIVDKIAVREKDHYVFVDQADIYYAYSHEKGTALKCQSDTFYTKIPLTKFSHRLPDHFLRIHRSYIVNSHQVRSIEHHAAGSYQLYLKDLPKIKIPVSKKYVPTVKQLLEGTYRISPS